MSSWDGSTTPFAQEPTRGTLPTNTNGEISERIDFRTSVIQLDRPGDPGVFSDAVRADAQTLIARYPAGQARSALLPMLHLVQAEQGYISPDGIAFCADTLGLTKAQVAAVATFYTMYKRHPTGEYLVSVCTNTLCGLMGGDEIFTAVAEELGLANNETSADGSITIERAECLAACDYAPVVTVNYEFFDNQSVDSTLGLVGALRSGQRPQPDRGAPLCSFRQASRQVAGFFTDEELAPEALATGAPTEAGVKLAVERGETAPSYAADSTDRAGGAAGAGARSGKARSAAGQSSAGPAPSGQGTPAQEQGKARGQGPSQNDAPLSTAESDPANSTDPGAEKG